MVNDAAVLLVGFFCKSEKDKTSRLAFSISDVKDIQAVVVLHPLSSDPPRFSFGPTSQARIVVMKRKSTINFFLELEADVKLDTSGCSATLTVAATAAYHSIIADGLDAQMRRLEKKFDKDVAERFSTMVVKSAPLKFVDGFVLNAHAFLHKPFTPTGMSESRSAAQFLALRRQQLLALGEDEEIVSEKVLRAAPIYFDREIFKELAARAHGPVQHRGFQSNESMLDRISKQAHGREVASYYKPNTRSHLLAASTF